MSFLGKVGTNIGTLLGGPIGGLIGGKVGDGLSKVTHDTARGAARGLLSSIAPGGMDMGVNQLARALGGRSPIVSGGISAHVPGVNFNMSFSNRGF